MLAAFHCALYCTVHFAAFHCVLHCTVVHFRVHCNLAESNEDLCSVATLQDFSDHRSQVTTALVRCTHSQDHENHHSWKKTLQSERNINHHRTSAPPPPPGIKTHIALIVYFVFFVTKCVISILCFNHKNQTLVSCHLDVSCYFHLQGVPKNFPSGISSKQIHTKHILGVV